MLGLYLAALEQNGPAPVEADKPSDPLPLAHAIICQGCKQEKSQSELSACGRCKAILYCSRECQKAAWATHKLVCKLPEVKSERVDVKAKMVAGAAVNLEETRVCIELQRMKITAHNVVHLNHINKQLKDSGSSIWGPEIDISSPDCWLMTNKLVVKNCNWPVFRDLVATRNKITREYASKSMDELFLIPVMVRKGRFKYKYIFVGENHFDERSVEFRKVLKWLSGKTEHDRIALFMEKRSSDKPILAGDYWARGIEDWRMLNFVTSLFLYQIFNRNTGFYLSVPDCPGISYFHDFIRLLKERDENIRLWKEFADKKGFHDKFSKFWDFVNELIITLRMSPENTDKNLAFLNEKRELIYQNGEIFYHYAVFVKNLWPDLLTESNKRKLSELNEHLGKRKGNRIFSQLTISARDFGMAKHTLATRDLSFGGKNIDSDVVRVFVNGALHPGRILTFIAAMLDQEAHGAGPGAGADPAENKEEVHDILRRDEANQEAALLALD